jgi:Domain of unknown function (DUF6398)
MRDDDWYDRNPRLVQAEMDEMHLWDLATEVGGQQVLNNLDDSPLPDEPFDWTGIAEDIVPCVAQILGHIDRCCDALLDVEYRTACRRLLARAALGDPRVFRRQAKTETAAAAIVWIVGSTNKIFDGPERLIFASRVVHFLGASSSASSRAETFRRAAGRGRFPFETHLGAAFLTSGSRRRIIGDRDWYRARLPWPCLGCPYVADADR